MLLHEILLERWREVKPYHGAKTAMDEQTTMLCAALTDWIGGEHGRAEVQQELLELAPVAAHYARTEAKWLYRGFALDYRKLEDLKTKRGFGIAIQAAAPLTSWSTDRYVCESFMEGFGKWVVFRKPAASLNVFCNLVLFNQIVKPFSRMDEQKEIIVRMAETMHVKATDIVVRSWNRKNTYYN